MRRLAIAAAIVSSAAPPTTFALGDHPLFIHADRYSVRSDSP
jgi:hypothetical protein